jgi:hypothetical protein
MRWTVEGADEKTGLDVTVTFEARSLDDAMDLARANGILPADGYPSGSRTPKAPPLSYASPAVATARPMTSAPSQVPSVHPIPVVPVVPAAPAIPEYKPILQGAKWLGTIAAILYVVAALCFLGAAITFLAWLGGTTSMTGLRAIESVAGSVQLLIGGFECLAAGAVIRMLAYLALAVRDIARNSWK